MERPKRILLVDNDARDVDLILNVLGEYDFAEQIVVARDGVIALDYLYRRGEFAQRPIGHPVAILLDLKMPRISGLEVLRELKTNEQMRRIPIVILSSSRESRDLAECYELGVNAYVVKPVKFAEFAETVKHLGVFWAMINEPPPGSVTAVESSPLLAQGQDGR